MKKYKKYLIYILIFVVLVVGVSVNINATLVDFQVLGGEEIDDFYSDTNGYNINGYVVGSYSINNTIEYFVDYYSTTTGYNILLTSNTFYNGSMTLEDDYYAIYNDDLFALISNINNYLLNNTDYNILLNYSYTYIINDYFDSVGYVHYVGGASNRLIGGLYPSSLEEYDNYMTNVGIENTFNIYGRFISFMRYYIDEYYNDYVDTILEGNTEELDEAYYRGYDEGFRDGLSTESLQEAYNDGYDKGYKIGYSDSTNQKKTFLSVLFGIFDTFINGVKDMFDVEVFGINLSSILVFIISISIIGFVLRKIF